MQTNAAFETVEPLAWANVIGAVRSMPVPAAPAVPKTHPGGWQ